MKRSAIVTLAFLTLAACAEESVMVTPDLGVTKGPNASEIAPRATYRITVENLTTGGGQYFTPPLLVVSQKAEDLFDVGRPASEALQQVAENGNLGPILERLGESHHVSSYAVAFSAPDFPPLAPGAAVTEELMADPGSNFLSFASMLICTNDGFTGLDGVKLPAKVGEQAQFYAGAFDAGTEINTEDAADLVPPCQALGGAMADEGETGTGESNPALAEGGVIRTHPGIQGLDDLDPVIHGWTDPVARVTVLRIG